MDDRDYVSLRLIYHCLDCRSKQEVYLPDPDLTDMFTDYETVTVDIDENATTDVIKLNCPDCGSGDFYPFEGSPGDEQLIDAFGLVGDP